MSGWESYSGLDRWADDPAWINEPTWEWEPLAGQRYPGDPGRRPAAHRPVHEASRAAEPEGRTDAPSHRGVGRATVGSAPSVAPPGWQIRPSTRYDGAAATDLSDTADDLSDTGPSIDGPAPATGGRGRAGRHGSPVPPAPRRADPAWNRPAAPLPERLPVNRGTRPVPGVQPPAVSREAPLDAGTWHDASPQPGGYGRRHRDPQPDAASGDPTTDPRLPRPRRSDRHRPEQPRPEQRYPEQLRPEQRYPEQRYPEQLRPEQRYPEQLRPEQRYPEQLRPEQRYPEQRYPEQRYPEQGRPEQSYPVAYRPELPRTDRPWTPPAARTARDQPLRVDRAPVERPQAPVWQWRDVPERDLSTEPTPRTPVPETPIPETPIPETPVPETRDPEPPAASDLLSSPAGTGVPGTPEVDGSAGRDTPAWDVTPDRPVRITLPPPEADTAPPTAPMQGWFDAAIAPAPAADQPTDTPPRHSVLPGRELGSDPVRDLSAALAELLTADASADALRAAAEHARHAAPPDDATTDPPATLAAGPTERTPADPADRTPIDPADPVPADPVPADPVPADPVPADPAEPVTADPADPRATDPAEAVTADPAEAVAADAATGAPVDGAVATDGTPTASVPVPRHPADAIDPESVLDTDPGDAAPAAGNLIEARGVTSDLPAAEPRSDDVVAEAEPAHDEPVRDEPDLDEPVLNEPVLDERPDDDATARTPAPLRRDPPGAEPDRPGSGPAEAGRTETEPAEAEPAEEGTAEEGTAEEGTAEEGTAEAGAADQTPRPATPEAATAPDPGATPDPVDQPLDPVTVTDSRAPDEAAQGRASGSAGVDPEQVLAAYPWRLDAGTLRELVDDPDELRAVRDRLTDKLATADRDAVRARLSSLRAVVSRVLGDLDRALEDGRAALEHAEATGELRRTAIVQARLAHVLQWRGDFAEADRLFAEANSVELPDRLRATMHEHAGRSCYDQRRYIEACNHFERALDLRRVDDPALIARTEVALDAVLDGVRAHGWGPYPRTREEILRLHRPPTPARGEHSRRWGYADPRGGFVVPPVYDDAQPFHEGVAWVRRPGSRAWDLIDEGGAVLIDASSGYLCATSYSDGLAWVSRNGTGGWYAIDERNRVVVPGGFDDVRPFRRGVAVVRHGGGWGAVDRRGHLVVQPRYRAIATALTDGRYVDGFTDEGLAVVDAGDRRGVVDRGGRLIVPPVHAGLLIHPVAFLIGDRSGRWGALDRRGEPLIDVRYARSGDVVDEIDRLLADTRPVL